MREKKHKSEDKRMHTKSYGGRVIGRHHTPVPPLLHKSLSRVMPIQGAASSSSPPVPHRAFQIQINPLTGDSEWIVIDGEASEPADEQSSPHSLLATTSYLDMLNDAARNRAFRLAIEKTITKPCHVLDIGAGTGLLSMMAARAAEAAGGGRVSACESYLPMGKLMRRVLRLNGMGKKVKVFHKRSDELRVGEDLESRADVLVSEILDSELLGEGLIPTLQHAHDNLLVENPKTVPYRATIFGQLVESTFLWKMQDLCNNEICAPDGIHLTHAGLGIGISVKQQHAMHCDALSAEIRLLSEPFEIFEFDFWKRPDSHAEREKQIKATDDGKIHAIVSWWVLQFDREGSIFYSTAPRWINSYGTGNIRNILGCKDWCDHWRQCVWFIPGMGTTVSRNDQVLIKAFHNETSISYSLEVDGRTSYNSFNLEHLMLLPERVALYGDNIWRMALSVAVKNALNIRASPLCVIADDSIYLTILFASLSKCSSVISAFPGLQARGACYLQAICNANGFSKNHIKIIGKRAAYLTKDDLNQGKIDLLVGEPFYCGNEGMLPWSNLRFWKERTILDSFLSEDVFIVPGKGILKACAMSLPDLWRSHCWLRNLEGFDHSVVNETLGACGDLPHLEEGPCIPCFVWQSGHIEELSEVFSIMEFDISKPIHACSGKATTEFSQKGLCHGFVFWIDWVLDESNSIVVSTGPASRYWKQGVKLLSKPMMVNVGECSAEIETSFEPSTGELIITSSFS